jgi:hypothetical protein
MFGAADKVAEYFAQLVMKIEADGLTTLPLKYELRTQADDACGALIASVEPDAQDEAPYCDPEKLNK